MIYKNISDKMPWIENMYILSEYGDLYSKIKSYNGSYKLSLRDKNNKPYQITVTSIIKPYLNNSETVELLDRQVVIYKGIPYGIRYNTKERTGYKRVFLKAKDFKSSTDRFRYGLHNLMNYVYNDAPLELSTHHIDRNRDNNHYSNLMSLSRSEHQRLHMLEDNPKRIYNSFVAIHNGIEGLVTCSLAEFKELTGVNRCDVKRGYTEDLKWIFKNHDLKV